MMLEPRSSLANYVRRLQSEGRVSFTHNEAERELGIKKSAFLKSAARLQNERMLLNPRHGFYVAVPPQYASWEAPPPNWFIDDLMRHEGRPYYVALLKAAELHGASHHAVMEFQVMTDKQLPKLRSGRSFIAFYFRKDIDAVAAGIESRKTDTGSMKISSVELTALDLLRYLHVVGGIDAVGTVLRDLAERIEGRKLISLASQFERAIIQRLGYLLERLGYSRAAEPLRARLFTKPIVPWIDLEPQPRHKPAPTPIERNVRWHVNVHRYPEIDE